MSQLRFMGSQIIKLRDPSFKELSKNWPQLFLKRNPKLTTRWARPMDNQRIITQSHEIVTHYFELYKHREKLNVQDRNC